MEDQRLTPNPYDPPFILRRPHGLEDFQRMEEHQRYWSFGTRVYQLFQVSELCHRPANSDLTTELAFYSPTAGRNRRIQANAKNWCFFLLEDHYHNIIGINICFGLTNTSAERHLRVDVDELPLEDLTWDHLYVPDPANQEQTQTYFTAVLTDWSKPLFAEPLMKALYHMGDLLPFNTLISQGFHEGDNEIWSLPRLNFRHVRTIRSKGEGEARVSVWRWTREEIHPVLQRQYVWGMEATSEQVAALTAFYQNLSRMQREELIYLIHGYSTKARVEQCHISKRTIDERRAGLRAALADAELEWMDRGGLMALGLDVSLVNERDISSYLCQPRVSQALKRIAWFYGEIPDDLQEKVYLNNGSLHWIEVGAFA